MSTFSCLRLGLKWAKVKFSILKERIFTFKFLNKIKLSVRFVNPRFYGDMSRGITTVTTNEDTITVGDQKLFPSEKLRVGEKVKLGVWQRNFYLWYQTEIDEYNKHKERIRLKNEKLARIEKEKQIKLKSKLSQDFWDQFNIPFEYEIQVKEVLSGLKEGSNGCGTNKRTKFHICFKEDYKQGRLTREAGDFLCSNSKSKWGANWSGSIGFYNWDKDSDGVKRLITCKSCLKKMERFKKKSS